MEKKDVKMLWHAAYGFLVTPPKKVHGIYAKKNLVEKNAFYAPKKVHAIPPPHKKTRLTLYSAIAQRFPRCS